MTRIVWTLQAIEDVEAIRAYIARDSPHYAALMAERIVESVERLKEFPRSGRVVPEVGQEAYREVIVGTTGLSTNSQMTGRTFSPWCMRPACSGILGARVAREGRRSISATVQRVAADGPLRSRR